MLVQVEMAPVGKRAPREKAFVPNARDDDPGSRLAFRVLVKDRGMGNPTSSKQIRSPTGWTGPQTTLSLPVQAVYSNL